MTDLKSLGYVKVQTADIERWRQFAFDVLGFAKGSGPDPDALYLRMDERTARIIVVPGDADRIVTVGWEVRDGAALRRVQATLDGAGVPWKQLSLEEADARRVDEVIAFADPAGNDVEVFHGAVLDHSPVVTPFGARFVTDGLGLGEALGLGPVQAAEVLADRRALLVALELLAAHGLGAGVDGPGPGRLAQGAAAATAALEGRDRRRGRGRCGRRRRLRDAAQAELLGRAGRGE